MFMTSSKHFKGTFLYQEPTWKTRLDEMDGYEMDKTGLSKEKLYDVLQILTENGVIAEN